MSWWNEGRKTTVAGVQSICSSFVFEESLWIKRKTMTPDEAGQRKIKCRHTDKDLYSWPMTNRIYGKGDWCSFMGIFNNKMMQ